MSELSDRPGRSELSGPVGATGDVGPAGATGPQGPAGANGNTVLHGLGAPAASQGSDGDFYVDTAADVIYGPKSGGAWPAGGTSLVGQTGAIGPQGLAGWAQPGATGATGATGAAGPQGPAGPASLSALQGTNCAIPGAAGTPGFPGVVNEGIASSGAITWTCAEDSVIGRVLNTSQPIQRIELQDRSKGTETDCTNALACGTNAIPLGDVARITFVSSQTKPFTFNCNGVIMTSVALPATLGQSGDCEAVLRSSNPTLESDANLG